MGLTLQELISLDHDTSLALGWRDGGNINIAYSIMEVGDIWIDWEIHYTIMENDLYHLFKSLNEKLKSIWGEKAKTIEFHDTDDEDNQSGHYVSIELAEVVINE